MKLAFSGFYSKLNVFALGIKIASGSARNNVCNKKYIGGSPFIILSSAASVLGNVHAKGSCDDCLLARCERHCRSKDKEEEMQHGDHFLYGREDQRRM